MALKILSFYHEDGSRAYFETPDHDYANNWAWLGLALYAGWVEILNNAIQKELNNGNIMEN